MYTLEMVLLRCYGGHDGLRGPVRGGGTRVLGAHGRQQRALARIVQPQHQHRGRDAPAAQPRRQLVQKAHAAAALAAARL